MRLARRTLHARLLPTTATDLSPLPNILPPSAASFSFDSVVDVLKSALYASLTQQAVTRSNSQGKFKRNDRLDLFDLRSTSLFPHANSEGSKMFYEEARL